MKKLLLSISAALAAAVLVFGSPGCSSTCEELSEVCDRCTDQDYASSCRQTVDEGDSAVCSGRLGTYQQFCPVVGEGGGGAAGGAGGGFACAPGEGFCDGGCVDLLSSLTNCGSCGNACDAASPFCVGGTCASECTSPPFSDCGGACVDTATSPDHCGACDGSCSDSEVCSEGSCVPECDTSETSRAPTQCGQSCVDLASDLLHCGACGNACDPGEVCSNGTCASACADGLTACCGECVDTSADAPHCGGCDEGCDGVADVGGGGGAGGAPGRSGPCDPAAPLCDGGECVAECTAPEAQCGSGCVDTNSNVSHCGACNNLCPSGASCSNGACTNTGCATGQTDCAGSCVELGSDAQNCGACGNACASGEVCSLGSCSGGCAPGLSPCNGGCFDTTTDPAHCGGCNLTCDGGTPSCQEGECAAACGAGFTDCGGGQCVNAASMSASNILHCGGCNSGCGDNNACTADSCNAGQCSNVGGGAICNDGNPCTVDTCDPITKCKFEPFTQPDLESLCLTLEGPSFDPSIACVYCNPLGEEPCQKSTPSVLPAADPLAQCTVSPASSGCGTCRLAGGAPSCDVASPFAQACMPPP